MVLTQKEGATQTRKHVVSENGILVGKFPCLAPTSHHCNKNISNCESWYSSLPLNLYENGLECPQAGQTICSLAVRAAANTLGPRTTSLFRQSATPESHEQTLSHLCCCQ